jgi:hypothetical protein
MNRVWGDSGQGSFWKVHSFRRWIGKFSRQDHMTWTTKCVYATVGNCVQWKQNLKAKNITSEAAPSSSPRSSLTDAHRCIGPRKPIIPSATSARLMYLSVSDSTGPLTPYPLFYRYNKHTTPTLSSILGNRKKLNVPTLIKVNRTKLNVPVLFCRYVLIDINISTSLQNDTVI